MNKSQKIVLIALLLAGFFLRFYKIESVPSGFYYDELDAGYQARSLIQTGKDYRGTLNPFYVNSFLDPRTPIPIYFTAISTFIFQSPELQVRMSSVILGVLNIALVFWLIFGWFKKFRPAFFVALVFATNPWQIQFSRFNHEGNSVIFFTLLGLNFFYKALAKNQKKYLFLSSIILSLAMYTYRTMSLFVPLILILLFILYKREIIKFGRKTIFLNLILIMAITLPFLYTTTFGVSDKPRIAQISIFSDQLTPILIQRNRELDSNDGYDKTIGKNAVKQSYLFHNKPFSYLETFASNYLKTFSVDFLFLKGDLNHRHSIPNQGMLLFADIFALTFGAFFLFKKLKDKKNKLLLSLLLIAPVPSSITGDGADHGARLITFSIFFLIVVGLGWEEFYIKASSMKFSKFYLLSVLTTWILIFGFYLHNYFIHSPVEAANMFSYGYKEAMTKIIQIEKDYQKVEFTQVKDPPILYYLFWAKIPPSQLQQYGTQFSGDIIKGLPLDKYKTSDLSYGQSPDELVKEMNQGTLYLVTQHELNVDLRYGQKAPKGIKVVDVISYPDGEVDFYLITKELDNR